MWRQNKQNQFCSCYFYHTAQFASTYLVELLTSPLWYHPHISQWVHQKQFFIPLEIWAINSISYTGAKKNSMQLWKFPIVVNSEIACDETICNWNQRRNLWRAPSERARRGNQLWISPRGSRIRPGAEAHIRGGFSQVHISQQSLSALIL